jgi:thiaminase/transcriptional activator TenA
MNSFSRGLKEKALGIWEDCYNHPFVQELGQGILDKSKFEFYLIQDYHYLLQYAKVFALGALKSFDESLMTKFSTIQYSILNDELDLHRNYMTDFGLSPEHIINTKPSLYNQTYTANMLAVGQTGGVDEIIATILPCAWTYADFAQRLKQNYGNRLEQNYYKSWIENYANIQFDETFLWMFDTLDALVADKSEEHRQKIEDIFIASVQFEYLFWDMAYKMELSFKL